MPEWLNIHSFSDDDIAERVAKSLALGGLAIIPTETVYGLAADARRDDAVARIYAVKQRDRGKPVALLAEDVGAIERFGAVLSPLVKRLAAAFWPGPLTMVLPCDGGWEGFRIPDFGLTQRILARSGGVLRVTSANASGEPAALTAAAAEAALGHGVETVVDAGHVPGCVASTVIKVAGDDIEILRPGPTSEAELRALI